MPATEADLLLQAPSTRAVLEHWRDPREDIEAERRASALALGTDTLSSYIALCSGAPTPHRQDELSALLASNAVFAEKRRHPFYDQVALHRSCMAMANEVMRLAFTGEFTMEELVWMREEIGCSLPDDVHHGMFVPTLLAQATAEQRERWVPDAMMQDGVLGTYAQTELGHGTFIRGLETTATYDPETQTFLIHTPTLSGCKWWPGGLGKTANTCVLFARTFVSGQDRGPHAFLLQLRDPVFHEPLPGITLGDIGPKLGFNGIDNGFLRLDHVRVARDAMLGKLARVSEGGEYELLAPPRANYGTMVHVRSILVAGAFKALGKAVTIAVRYSAVRRQGTPAGPGLPEPALLDYQNQQHQLLPLLAASYALLFTQVSMRKQYEDFVRDSGAGNFDGLADLHLASSGLKALCTTLALDGIEQCRRACGGHGYSRFSGLPTLLSDYSAMVTLEGDTNVLYMQTARALLKQQQQRAPQGVGAQAALSKTPDFEDPRVQRQLWDTLVAYSLGTVDAASNVDLISVARAHAYSILCSSFADTAGRDRPELRDLCSLFSLHSLEAVGGITRLLEAQVLTPAGARSLRRAAWGLLPRIRRQAVALVDSFHFSDYCLGSAIGRYDGNVYQALFDWAQESPVNTDYGSKGPSFPVLTKHLHRSKM